VQAHRSPLVPALVAIILFTALALPAARPAEPVDRAAVERIRDEGLQRSQVMALASYVTDVHGPRLTGSPQALAAAEWMVETLRGWGAANPRLEEWGTFGRGWTNERFTAHVISPQPWPILGAPKAWTPGTGGVVTADAVYAPMTTEKDFDAWRGRLRGTIVLPAPPRDLDAQFEPQARRFTDAQLEVLGKERAEPGEGRPPVAAYAFAMKRLAFLAGEEVTAVFEPSRGAGGGTIFVQQGGHWSASGHSGWPERVPPQVVLTPEHYGRIVRVLEKDLPVSIELLIQNRMTDDDQPGVNVLADLPGGDRRDEVVMLGAHYDSWHGGTGATDNGAGVAVVLEAFRLLKASGLTMRRTVTLALWSGEEQGLFGSRAFVARHLADRESMHVKPAHGKLSAYFNVDNGAGAIRGVYLQGNQAVAPIFRAWMAPFADLGMTTLAPRATGGTDHVAFDAVGIPAFQFIQDELEYRTRSHHSTMDSYERLQADDLKKNAVIVAAFVYHAANRDGRLPRKPLPTPRRGT
jgi:carboxypeptidase Q